MKKIIATIIYVCAVLLCVAPMGATLKADLLGAGATFPYPIYSKMFDIYSRQSGVKVNYQPIGSGGGIRQLMSQTVDFGGTDAYITDKELEQTPQKILHIPTCVGAVVVVYNLPGNPKLRLTPEIISGIFTGEITRWNDPKIKQANPGVSLPGMNIFVIHRSDGSGTTYVFSDYLSSVSDQWKRRVGKGKSLNWPVGLGAKGNPGVAGFVKQTPGAAGYVELVYALQNNMTYAEIKNSAGNFIYPSIQSVSLAADIELPPDTRIYITNTPKDQGYPISSFTWIIFYKEQNYEGRSKQRAQQLVNLLWWMIHQGQEYTRPLGYAPLPRQAVNRAEAIIKSTVYNGKPLR
ncbi:MAG: phosphate ABC transporter substrate-binding protein PstS [Spirochaetota bacterium]